MTMQRYEPPLRQEPPGRILPEDYDDREDADMDDEEIERREVFRREVFRREIFRRAKAGKPVPDNF